MSDPAPAVAVLAVALGGALGALLRTGLSRALARDWFPVGTLAVNVLGSFALGLLTGLAPGETLRLFVGEGVCGAFTTFSSFSVETVRLVEGGHRRRAVLNVGLTLALGLSAAGLGFVLASVSDTGGV